MKKRILCALMILALTASASGCGQQAARSSDSVKTDTVTNGVTADTKGAEFGETAAEDYGGDDIAFDGFAAAEATTTRGASTATATAGATADTFGDSATARATSKKATDDKAESKTVESEVELPEAGQLTAGEWNDNENWGFFSNLVNSEKISFPSFGIYPNNRTAVTVKDKDGSAVVNARVVLLDGDGNTLWSAVTNKEGIAYLFNQTKTPAVSVEVESGGKKQSYKLNDSKSNEQGAKNTDTSDLEVTFDGKGELYKNTDIMFIVDSTGSMGDEMLFLQSEFTEITKAVGTENTRYSVNFYRDEGDEYVTKCSDFTTDIKSLQKTLNSEEAAGGGDYPEAVAEILKETVFDGGWKDDSVKLAFLIFDAPPHSGTDDTIVKTVEEAAKKGIRIIPIVASDSDRDTELFGRALSITTGGDYVFLTDDSGIGNSHTEPIIGSYEVRKLYNVIIDIIKDYKQ